MITAEELRKMVDPDKDYIDALAYIKNQVKQEALRGKYCIYYSYDIFSYHNRNFVQRLEATLKEKGYEVCPGGAPRSIVISWLPKNK